MEKTKEKGITLIALVITIVVLLILAGVSVSNILGDNGIIARAKEAKNKTNESNIQEENILQEIEDWANSVDGWKDNGDRTFDKNGVTLKVGDYLNYVPESGKSYISPTGTYQEEEYERVPEVLEQGSGYSTEQTFNTSDYTGGWRVLGVERGKLKIISADSVKDFTLRGYSGATYGEQELDSACAIFGTGEYAVNARSMNADDVNKITGYNPNNVGVYDPEQIGIGIKCYDGKLYEYGNEVTYTWGSTEGAISATGSENTAIVKNDTYNASIHSTYGFNYHNNFKWTSSKYAKEETICKIKATDYFYYPNTLTTSSIGNAEGTIGENSKEYSTIFCNSNNKKINYWLASSFIHTGTLNAAFGLYYVDSEGYIGRRGLNFSYGRASSFTIGVRPIVLLKANTLIDTTDASRDGSSQENAYVLK